LDILLSGRKRPTKGQLEEASEGQGLSKRELVGLQQRKK
jgi:hypothetical protein